jgi:hypothetical protein
MPPLRLTRLRISTLRYYSTPSPPSEPSPEAPKKPAQKTHPSHLRNLNRAAINSSTPFTKPAYPESGFGGYSDREYKKAARRWGNLIWSLPVFLVSSWWLVERLYLGKEQRKGLFESPQGVGYIGNEKQLEEEVQRIEGKKS